MPKKISWRAGLNFGHVCYSVNAIKNKIVFYLFDLPVKLNLFPLSKCLKVRVIVRLSESVRLSPGFIVANQILRRMFQKARHFSALTVLLISETV